jgi:DNA-binding winged helix-turn-helix (wHTH) protein
VPEERPAPSPVDYRFGPFHFDGRLRRLFKGGEPLALTTKAADTLAALLERAGRVVEKDELLRAVWHEVVVGEETLAQNISTLRRVLEDDPARPQFIATVPRRGYKFVATVRTGQPAPGVGLTEPSGTARLLIHGDTGKIGRLCVLPEKRGTGLGHALMAKALDVLRAQGMKSAVLAAQIHAVRFYEGIGFHAYGPEYDDAGIAHRDMVLPL